MAPLDETRVFEVGVGSFKLPVKAMITGFRSWVKVHWNSMSCV